eukprot:Awhi_evm1s7717
MPTPHPKPPLIEAEAELFAQFDAHDNGSLYVNDINNNNHRPASYILFTNADNIYHKNVFTSTRVARFHNLIAVGMHM